MSTQKYIKLISTRSYRTVSTPVLACHKRPSWESVVRASVQHWGWARYSSIVRAARRPGCQSLPCLLLLPEPGASASSSEPAAPLSLLVLLGLNAIVVRHQYCVISIWSTVTNRPLLLGGPEFASLASRICISLISKDPLIYINYYFISTCNLSILSIHLANQLSMLSLLMCINQSF